MRPEEVGGIKADEIVTFHDIRIVVDIPHHGRCLLALGRILPSVTECNLLSQYGAAQSLEATSQPFRKAGVPLKIGGIGIPVFPLEITNRICLGTKQSSTEGSLKRPYEGKRSDIC